MPSNGASVRCSLQLGEHGSPDDVELAELPERWLAALSEPHPTIEPSDWPQPSLNLRALSKAGQRRLRFGDDGVGDKSRLALMIANPAVRRGWNVCDLYEAMMDPRNRGGEALQRRVAEKGDAAGKAWLNVVWAKAQDALRSGVHVERVVEVQDAMAAVSWRGRGVASQHAVLEALCDACLDAQALAFEAPLRPLALNAGCALGTAVKAMAELVRKGWVEVVDHDGYHGSTRVRLTVPPDLQVDTPSTWGEDVEDVSPSDVGEARTTRAKPSPGAHDLWRYGNGSLGPVAGRIWRAAVERHLPFTVADLACELGLSPPQVRNGLHRLASVGLAERLSRLQWLGVARALDEVVQEIDVPRRGERQQRLYERERQVFESHRRSRSLRVLDGKVVDIETGEVAQVA